MKNKMNIAMVMGKRRYTLPQVSVTSISVGHLMDTSMNVLPPQPAPRRRTDVF